MVAILSVLLRLYLYQGFRVLFIDFSISVNVELPQGSFATFKVNSAERLIDWFEKKTITR